MIGYFFNISPGIGGGYSYRELNEKEMRGYPQFSYELTKHGHGSGDVTAITVGIYGEEPCNGLFIVIQKPIDPEEFFMDIRNGKRQEFEPCHMEFFRALWAACENLYDDSPLYLAVRELFRYMDEFYVVKITGMEKDDLFND